MQLDITKDNKKRSTTYFSDNNDDPTTSKESNDDPTATFTVSVIVVAALIGIPLVTEQNRTLVYYSLTSTYTHARTMIYMIETF